MPPPTHPHSGASKGGRRPRTSAPPITGQSGTRLLDPPRAPLGEGTIQPPRSVLIWSVAISALVVLCSAAGLTDSGVYAHETPNWATQAQGQDVGNLLAVAVLLLAARGYRNGSARAGLVWLGTLLYVIYAFILYAVAVHLNALFLVYVAVLGLSAWAIVFHVGPLRRRNILFPYGPARTAAACVILTTGVLFAVLWLSELVPALLSGQVPQSLLDAGLWVNPIHVIDLAVVLPGFLISGVATLRSREHGLFWLGPWLVFSALMGASIVAVMVLMTARGDGSAIPVAALVSVVVVASLLAATRYLRAPEQ